MEYIDYRILECLLITNDSIVTEANISLSNFINDNKDYFAMIMRHYQICFILQIRLLN